MFVGKKYKIIQVLVLALGSIGVFKNFVIGIVKDFLRYSYWVLFPFIVLVLGIGKPLHEYSYC